MIKQESNFFLYILFFCVFFWDILDDIFPKCQLVILVFLFLIYIIKNKSIKIHKNSLIFWIALLVHAFVNIIVGNDTFLLFITQFVTIAVCVIIYTNLVSKVSISEVMSVYLNYAVFTSLIGVIEECAGIMNMRFLAKLPLFFTYTNFDYRVAGLLKISSICREPSFLGYILAPAMCMVICKFFAPEFVDNNIKFLNSKFEMCMVVLAYIFTFSSVAYLGIVVMFLTIWLKKKISLKKLLLPLVIVALCGVAYIYIPDVQIRVNDTLSIFSDNTSSDTVVNLSSYTYYSNYNVTKQTLKYTKGMGCGLGGYQVMFDKFEPLSWGNSDILLNREDANSGFFRIASEMGIMGVLVVVMFLYKYMPNFISPQNVYSIAFFCLIIMYLLRQGNYIHAGSILFICMYIKNYKEVIKNVQTKKNKCCDIKL